MASKFKAAKNNHERQNYRRSVQQQAGSLETTGHYDKSKSLEGSKTPSSFEPTTSNLDVCKPTIASRIMLQYKKIIVGALSIIASAILTVFISTTVSWGLDYKAEKNVIDYRISTIEKKIEQLDDNSISKEVLDLKLEIVKNESNALFPSIERLSERISEIESRIDSIEQGSDLAN